MTTSKHFFASKDGIVIFIHCADRAACGKQLGGAGKNVYFCKQEKFVWHDEKIAHQPIHDHTIIDDYSTTNNLWAKNTQLGTTNTNV